MGEENGQKTGRKEKDTGLKTRHYNGARQEGGLPFGSAQGKKSCPTHEGEEKRANLKIGHYEEKKRAGEKAKADPEPAKGQRVRDDRREAMSGSCGSFDGSVGAKKDAALPFGFVRVKRDGCTKAEDRKEQRKERV